MGVKMTGNAFAEALSLMSEDELVSTIRDAGLSLNPSPTVLLGLLMQERIRRHALDCSDLECGFNPLG
jgi:hypothetical protein